MNFQEFIDKLLPEDRQLVVDHFVRSVLGQGPKEEVVIRRTAKISTLGTEDEMIKEISQAFNISVEQKLEVNLFQLTYSCLIFKFNRFKRNTYFSSSNNTSNADLQSV